MMQTLSLDRYQAGASPIHRLDPRVKVVVAVLYIVSNVLLPDGAWLTFLLSWAVVVGCNLLAELGPGFTLRRSFVALPFALAAVTTVIAPLGQPLVTIALGPLEATVTEGGLIRFASILARSWLSVQMAILLTATTSFPDLMHALRHLRVPSIIVAVISFMYRYLFVLTDEAARLLRGRLARSARLDQATHGGSVAWRARVAGGMAGQLFLRSYERSDRVYSAMLARGYRGELLTINPHVLRQRDLAAAGFALVTLLLLQLVGWTEVRL